MIKESRHEFGFEEARMSGGSVFETGVKEAVICYNGPPPHRPEAKPFLHKALNTYFEGGPEKWNFAHEDTRFRGIVWAGGSKVIDRQLKVKPRLPSACY